MIGESTAFCMLTPEIAVLMERVLTLDRRVRAQWRSIPEQARPDYVDTMIIDEIQATNDIEHLRSTRKEIGAALEALQADRATGSKRFVEMVRMYAALNDRAIEPPIDLDGVRRIYDAVAADEVAPSDAPDGERFRVGAVTVWSGTKQVQVGRTPESAVNEGLSQMLAQNGDESIPQLIRAVVAHLMFENVHPFYDGNGRTGRFLLALDLQRILAPVTCLPLSATVADNKERYYRAFVDAEQPLNRGDVTPFVITVLEILVEAVDRLRADLVDRRGRIDRLGECLTRQGVEGDRRDILFIVGQAFHFAPGGVATLKSLAGGVGKSTQFVRPRIRDLVDEGLVDQISARPLRFRLSDAGRALLELDGSGS